MNDHELCRSETQKLNLTDGGVISNTVEGFSIHIDVGNFRPKDVQITVADDRLFVEGGRIETLSNEANTLFTRTFNRTYALPPDIRVDAIKSYFFADGTLQITGKRRIWKETSLDN